MNSGLSWKLVKKISLGPKNEKESRVTEGGYVWQKAGRTLFEQFKRICDIKLIKLSQTEN